MKFTLSALALATLVSESSAYLAMKASTPYNSTVSIQEVPSNSSESSGKASVTSIPYYNSSSIHTSLIDGKSTTKSNLSCASCTLSTYADSADYIKPAGVAAIAFGLAAVLI